MPGQLVFVDGVLLTGCQVLQTIVNLICVFVKLFVASDAALSWGGLLVAQDLHCFRFAEVNIRDRNLDIGFGRGAEGVRHLPIMLLQCRFLDPKGCGQEYPGVFLDVVLLIEHLSVPVFEALQNSGVNPLVVFNMFDLFVPVMLASWDLAIITIIKVLFFLFSLLGDLRINSHLLGQLQLLHEFDVFTETHVVIVSECRKICPVFRIDEILLVIELFCKIIQKDYKSDDIWIEMQMQEMNVPFLDSLLLFLESLSVSSTRFMTFCYKLNLKLEGVFSWFGSSLLFWLIPCSLNLIN